MDSQPEDTESDGVPADAIEMEAEAACDLVSEHGGEIIIRPDGRIVFLNASEHLVELAHALDPENEDVRKRMEVIRRTRAERSEEPPGEAETG